MLSATETARYSRQIMLPEIGTTGQEKLKAAKVLVAGAGGLGCPALQYLAAAGVGTIGIADGDRIERTNLQRQILYTEAEIGLYKAEAARQKIQSLNPHCTVYRHIKFIDEHNVAALIEQYDIIVDGTDNFSSRYLLNDACMLQGKPLVSGAIFRFEGQVSVFNYRNGPTYRCLFPEPPAAGETPNCSDIGVVASLPGIVGAIQVNEVIKMITGAGEVLSGKLLVIDALTMQTSIFHFPANTQNGHIQIQPGSSRVFEPGISYEILQQEIAAGKGIMLLDVREPEEHAAFNIGGCNIPLSVLETTQLPVADHPVVVYCASGIRSAKAIQILRNKGLSDVRSLTGGIRHLQLP